MDTPWGYSELMTESSTTPLVKDPVCGMDVDPATSPHHHEVDGRSYHFCSAGCRTS